MQGSLFEGLPDTALKHQRHFKLGHDFNLQLCLTGA